MALSSNQIKLIRQLHLKKNRTITKQFIVEGDKLVKELLQSNWEVVQIYSLASVANGYLGPVQVVSEKDMARISMFKSASNVLAVAKQKEWPPLINPQKILLLDGINDPGNLGTIIRTADWFGFEGIICSENTVELYNAKVLQSTMGSVFRMPIFYGSLTDNMTHFHEQGLDSVVTHLNGEIKMPTNLNNYMLIMGSESHGVSSEVLALAKRKVKIPGIGKAESLNVGVATGIMCYALLK